METTKTDAEPDVAVLDQFATVRGERADMHGREWGVRGQGGTAVTREDPRVAAAIGIDPGASVCRIL